MIPESWLPRLRRLDRVTINLAAAGTWAAFALASDPGAAPSAWVAVPGRIPTVTTTEPRGPPASCFRTWATLWAWPASVGYHESFRALLVVGAACDYLALFAA